MEGVWKLVQPHQARVVSGQIGFVARLETCSPFGIRRP